MVALNLLILCLMEIPARCFEMKPTHSEIEAAIAWRTFLFLLLNMLVMPSLAMDAANDFFLQLGQGEGNATAVRFTLPFVEPSCSEPRSQTITDVDVVSHLA